jgi:hypothetical protein
MILGPKHLTLPAAAEWLGMDPRRLRRMVRAGRIKAWNASAGEGVAARYMIEIAELQRFVDSRRT